VTDDEPTDPELTTRAGLLKPTLTYRLEPSDGGTRFSRRVDVQPSGVFRIMEPMMRSMVQKGNARFVQNLKNALER
jgi:carbon monoxide dehydrogenase subunit G